MSGEACYYATLLYSHGKSCCGLAFITNTYNSPLELLKCMNLITILHEAAHMYKRQNRCNSNSWNSDLKVFQQAIKNLQAGGEQNKEIFRSNRYSQEFLDETSLRCSGYASRFYG